MIKLDSQDHDILFTNPCVSIIHICTYMYSACHYSSEIQTMCPTCSNAWQTAINGVNKN